MAVNVSIEGVSYTISAKDVSAPEVEKAIAGTKKLNSAVDSMESKMKTQFANIQKHWVAYSAAAIAAVAAVSKAWDLAESAAGYIEQMQLLDGLAKQYKTSSTEITNNIMKVGDGMISMKTAAEVATSAMAKGLKPDQIVNLGKAAVTLSDIMGKTVDQTFRDLSAAMETGKEKSIKLAVGVIDLKDKYGLAADKMTEYEKQQALYNMVMDKSSEIQAGFGESTKSIADQMETFKVRLENVKLEISMGLIRAGAGLIAIWDALGAASLTVSSAFWKIVQVKERLQAMVSWGEAEKRHNEAASQAAQNAADDWQASLKLAEKAQQGVSFMTASTEELVKSQAKSNAAIKTGTTGLYEREKALEAEKKAIEAALQKMVEETRKANIELEGLGKTQYEKDLARIESEAEKHLAATKNRVAVNEWKNVQIQLAEQKQSEEIKKQIDKNADDLAKAMQTYYDTQEKERKEAAEADNKYEEAKVEAAKKATQEKLELAANALGLYKAMMTDEADFAATENERAINKIIANEGEKLNKLYQIYADGGISYKTMKEAEVQINKNAKAAILEKETENALKISNLNASLISGIRGREGEAYQERIKEIGALAQKQIKDGADHAAVMARKREDTEKAYLDMGYKTEGWYGGVKAGLIEIERGHKTWAESTKALTLDFANASKTAVSDILFQAIKTGTVDMKTVWDNFCGSMLRKITDTIAEMVTTAIAKDIMMYFKADWTKDSSNVLAIIRGAMNLWNSITEGYASGGMIPGRAMVSGDSPANDTVIARVSPGEYIIPRTAVNAQTLPVLEYMRSNKGLPGYADGGIVYNDYPYLSGFRDSNSPYVPWPYGGWYNPPENPDDPTWVEREPWQSAWSLGQSLNKRFANKPDDPDMSMWLKTWGEDWMKMAYEPDQVPSGWSDYLVDAIGTLNMPRARRIFYQDETYTDEGYGRSEGWQSKMFGQIIGAAAALIITIASAGVGKALGAGTWLGAAGGKALGAGAGAAGVAFMTSGGDWQSALLAGIVAAATVGISDYFFNAGAPADTGGYLDNGEFLSWQADPSYTDALYSDVGRGSTPSWWGNILKSAGRFVGKNVVRYALKIGAGMLGKDGSNRGHATYSYDSTDDGGIFGGLAGWADLIAPQTSPMTLNFVGGGGYPAFNGLEYVPYDNFPARLHKGERVQTASEVSGLMGEIKGLREDLNSIGIALLQRANKTGRAIEGFTVDGAPAVRVSVQ